MAQTTILLNDFGLQRRDRTTASGVKSRYTVEIKSEPLVHVYNPKAMGEGPATAIAEQLRAAVQNIKALASPSTQRKRLQAERAFQHNKSWATKRYAGGRMGSMQPDSAEGAQGALFNDSGRFAKSIVANATRDDAWIVNMAANRLDPSTFPDGEGGVLRMIETLRRYVPQWGDARAIAALPAVKQEIALAADMIIVNKLGAAYTRNKKLRADLRRGVNSALFQGARMLGGL